MCRSKAVTSFSLSMSVSPRVTYAACGTFFLRVLVLQTPPERSAIADVTFVTQWHLCLAFCLSCLSFFHPLFLFILLNFLLLILLSFFLTFFLLCSLSSIFFPFCLFCLSYISSFFFVLSCLSSLHYCCFLCHLFWFSFFLSFFLFYFFFLFFPLCLLFLLTFLLSFWSCLSFLHPTPILFV